MCSSRRRSFARVSHSAAVINVNRRGFPSAAFGAAIGLCSSTSAVQFCPGRNITTQSCFKQHASSNLAEHDTPVGESVK